MKTASIIGIIVTSSLVGCGAVVPLNGGGGDLGGHDGGAREASTVDPAEAGPGQGSDAEPGPDAPACGSSSGLGIIISSIVHRFAADGTTTYPFRPANEDPNGIDAKDCTDNIGIQFQLRICGLPTTDTFQVWAGSTDCTQANARSAGSSGPFCWRVAPNFAAATVTTSTIDVRAITQFIGDTSSDVLAYTPSPSVTPGIHACDPVAGLSRCGEELSIYFMAVKADDITIDGVPAEYTLSVVPDATNLGSCGGCGLAFYPSGYPSSCQTALDDTCCADEQACAASADCVRLVNCINACPSPRQDSCINACAPIATAAPAAFSALAGCSKTEPPPDGSDPSACDWPN